MALTIIIVRSLTFLDFGFYLLVAHICKCNVFLRWAETYNWFFDVLLHIKNLAFRDRFTIE